MSSWLGIEPRKTVALHASRSVELDLAKEEAFARCKSGVEQVLGGVVTAERRYEWLEASFGLVHSERLTCTLTAIDPQKTCVTIETRRGVQRDAPPSGYLSALARYLAG